ncbi:MAG: alpha/beta hydrolase [Candidatus Nanopelagicaceae bacterium]|nr:alpha/beta hydrolase [Candidatus Nanopelagicaceae bacterium]
MLRIERTKEGPNLELDPDSKRVVEFWNSQAPRPIQDTPLDEARNSGLLTTDITGPSRPLATIIDSTVTASDGFDIPIRIYRPALVPAPVVLYAHGGGWTLLSIESCDVFLREMALEVGCIVVSVGYRLSPENPYPIPFSDCWDALTWLNDGNLGFVPERIAVSGDSAGGNLAAGLALKSRDLKDGMIDFQLLLYPACGTDLDTPSMIELGPDPRFRLSKGAMGFFWNNYLAGNIESRDPYAVPHTATSYTSVAPALVVVAGFDPLKDDGRMYAEKLAQGGVETELLIAATLPHGFVFTLGAVPEARRVVNIIFEKLRRALHVNVAVN